MDGRLSGDSGVQLVPFNFIKAKRVGEQESVISPRRGTLFAFLFGAGRQENVPVALKVVCFLGFLAPEKFQASSKAVTGNDSSSNPLRLCCVLQQKM